MLHLPNNSYPIWHKTIIHCTSTWDLLLAQLFQYPLFRILLFGISPSEEFFSWQEIQRLGFLLPRNPFLRISRGEKSVGFPWREIQCSGVLLARNPLLGIFAKKSTPGGFFWREICSSGFHMAKPISWDFWRQEIQCLGFLVARNSMLGISRGKKFIA